MSSPDEWFRSIPPVTKSYFVASAITTIGLTIGVFPFNPTYFYLDYTSVFKKFQLWRLLTNFIYFGPINQYTVFGLIFTFTMMVRYGRELEGNFYNGFSGLCKYTF